MNVRHLPGAALERAFADAAGVGAFVGQPDIAVLRWKADDAICNARVAVEIDDDRIGLDRAQELVDRTLTQLRGAAFR